MYPYNYGNYYYPTIFDTNDYDPDMSRMQGAPQAGMPGAGMPGFACMPMYMQQMPAGQMPMGQMPMGQPVGQMPEQMGPMQPLDDDFFEEQVPGTTAGLPVESVTPAPITMPTPVDFSQEEGPPVTTNIEYTQAYLRTKIGSRVKIEFLIGTNSMTDRLGTIVDVGISYIILRLAESDDLLLADIYAIKFVTFYL